MSSCRATNANRASVVANALRVHREATGKAYRAELALKAAIAMEAEGRE